MATEGDSVCACRPDSGGRRRRRRARALRARARVRERDARCIATATAPGSESAEPPLALDPQRYSGPAAADVGLIHDGSDPDAGPHPSHRFAPRAGTDRQRPASAAPGDGPLAHGPARASASVSPIRSGTVTADSHGVMARLPGGPVRWSRPGPGTVQQQLRPVRCNSSWPRWPTCGLCEPTSLS